MGGGREELDSSVSVVHKLWRNDFRYASARRIKEFLRQGRHDQGIKGDPTKETFRRVLEAAGIIIRRGAVRWDRMGRSPRK